MKSIWQNQGKVLGVSLLLLGLFGFSLLSAEMESYSRGLLGIMLDDFRTDGETETSDAFLGSQVVEVTPGLPADRAGIRQGDVILAIDEESIESTTHLQILVSNKQPGRVVHLTLVREAGILSLPVRIGSWEAYLLQAPTFGPFFSMIQLEPLTFALKRKYQIGEDSFGLVITSIAEDSMFSDMLSTGTVVRKINGNSIRTREEILKFMGAGLNHLEIEEGGWLASLPLKDIRGWMTGGFGRGRNEYRASGHFVGGTQFHLSPTCGVFVGQLFSRALLCTPSIFAPQAPHLG